MLYIFNVNSSIFLILIPVSRTKKNLATNIKIVVFILLLKFFKALVFLPNVIET